LCRNKEARDVWAVVVCDQVSGSCQALTIVVGHAGKAGTRRGNAIAACVWRIFEGVRYIIPDSLFDVSSRVFVDMKRLGANVSQANVFWAEKERGAKHAFKNYSGSLVLVHFPQSWRGSSIA